ncbi:MAG: flippase-like domain-containing protein [Ilumatobacteraceae bacterium]|nr:flippase-like domain-containing protein [Ilumatobacteraceae bacterium]
MGVSAATGMIRTHLPLSSGGRVRLFVDARDQPRSRRATDVLLLVATGVGLLLLALAADPQPGVGQAFTDFVSDLPGLLSGLWEVLIELPALLAVVIVIATIAARRWAILRDLVLAIFVGGLIWLVLSRLTNGSWPAVGDVTRKVSSPEDLFAAFPAARLAVPGAVIITVSPHLVKPMRRLGRWTLAGAAVGALLLINTTAVGAVGGLLTGSAAAAIVHLLVGSSAGRPNLGDVASALDDLGVPVVALGAAARQQSGNFAVFADSADGRRLLIKLYGRDAYDSAIVATVWRRVWYRNAGSPVGFARRRQVEHEAFITLLAERTGIVTDHVVTAGSTPSDDAVLVLERTAFEVDDSGDDPRDDPLRERVDEHPVADDDSASALWALLEELHRAGIAHGQVDDEHLLTRDGRLGLENFRSATVNSTDDRQATDVAQGLVTLALRLGGGQAIESLVSARGHEAVVAVLPYVQPSSLTSFQRRRIRETELDLDELRQLTADAVGEEPPELEPLRRFTIGSVVSTLLPLVALAALISAASGIDAENLGDEYATAMWWLVAIGAVIAQLPRLAQAVATLGASPVPLPLGPVYALQLAVSYINLAIPSSAARIAVNIRFFQRHGVPSGGAVATGAVDGFAGFIVQAMLLVSLLILTPATINLGSSGGDEGDGGVSLVAVFVIAGLIGLIAVFLIPRTRRRIVEWVRRAVRDGAQVLRGLRSPRRLAMIFGGNLTAELLFALALTAFVRAFNGDVSYTTVLFTNMTVALLAGLLPIPGGIGVTEGGLILGLTSAGMGEEAAFAAVITYRIASFYLPPVWGFFALRWLERNRHL